MRPWQEIVPEEERQICNKAGYGKGTTLGKNVGLLVVDASVGFIGAKKDGIDLDFKTICPGADQIVPNLKSLIDIFRDADKRIIYTTGNSYLAQFVGGATKRPRSKNEAHGEQDEIHPEIKPNDDELIIHKTGASAFFATPLVTYLVRNNIDSLFIVGLTTSGCIRASVIDAFSYGFKVFVIEDAVYDRSCFLHMTNLFDMNAKYADVITTKEALDLLGR